MKRLLIAAYLILLPFSGAYGRDAGHFRIDNLLVFGGATLFRYSKIPEYWYFAPYYSYQDQSDLVGPAAGVGVEVPFGGQIRLDVRLHYLRKGTRVNWYTFDMFTGDAVFLETWKYGLHALGTSVAVKVKPFPRSFPYLLAGCDFGWTAAHRLALPDDYPSPNPANLKGETRGIDFGLIAGLGAELRTQGWNPFLEVRYHLGLSDLGKDVFLFPTLRTRSFVFLAGIKVRLKKD